MDETKKLVSCYRIELDGGGKVSVRSARVAVSAGLRNATGKSTDLAPEFRVSAVLNLGVLPRGPNAGNSFVHPSISDPECL
jgi:uncharacterized protein (DUF736 family)